MERLIQAVDHWLLDRPSMNENNTPRRVLELLCDEMAELCEAGDGKTDEELRADIEFHQEIADCLLYILSLCRQLSICPVAIGMEKVSYNMLRYESQYYQGGDFHDAMKWNRERTKRLRLKEQFYSASFL